MKPGATTLPVASMRACRVRRAARRSGGSTRIRSPSTTTVPGRRGAPVPSTIVPPRDEELDAVGHERSFTVMRAVCTKRPYLTHRRSGLSWDLPRGRVGHLSLEAPQMSDVGCRGPRTDSADNAGSPNGRRGDRADLFKRRSPPSRLGAVPFGARDGPLGMARCRASETRSSPPPGPRPGRVGVSEITRRTSRRRRACLQRDAAELSLGVGRPSSQPRFGAA